MRLLFTEGRVRHWACFWEVHIFRICVWIKHNAEHQLLRSCLVRLVWDISCFYPKMIWKSYFNRPHPLQNTPSTLIQTYTWHCLLIISKLAMCVVRVKPSPCRSQVWLSLQQRMLGVIIYYWSHGIRHQCSKTDLLTMSTRAFFSLSILKVLYRILQQRFSYQRVFQVEPMKELSSHNL